MDISRKRTALRYERDGIVSYLLVSIVTTGSEHLTTSLVEVSPGGRQHVHSHDPEQCYYILEGEGLMTIGDETERVGARDCVFIPSNESHGLENVGDTILKYFSAAAPSFGRENLLTMWPLRSEAGSDSQSVRSE